MRHRQHAVAAHTYPLGIGALAIGTSGYSITGLMPAISHQLHIPAAGVGQLSTVFAATCSVAGLITLRAARGWDRRFLAVIALTVTGLGNVLATVAPTFGWLLAARLVTAAGAATYTGTAAALAADLNPPSARGRALAVVFGGLAVALLIGVPAASALAATSGWRAACGTITGLCAVAAAAVACAVPRPAVPSATGAPNALPVEQVPGRRAAGVIAIIAASSLGFVGMFCLYTYLAPLLAAAPGARGPMLSVLLAAYGIGALAGVLAGGWATDRAGSRRTLLLAYTTCAVAAAALPAAAATVPSTAVVLAVLGFGFWASSAPIAGWLAQHSTPPATTTVLAVNAAAVYGGIAVGGLLGGLLVAVAGFTVLAPVATTVFAIAIAMVLSTPPPHRPVLALAAAVQAVRRWTHHVRGTTQPHIVEGD